MKMIIMAGGSGSRLWPLSRTHYPKQFLKLNGMEHSIFQLTLERCLLMGKMEDIYIVSSSDYLHLIRGQIEEIGLDFYQDHVLLEPVPKNTLPAIMYAVCAIRRGGNDVCAVFASDHIIERPDVLASTILQTQALARQGFVTFGIVPTEPETGYGYIKPGPKVPGGMEVSEFKEKPDQEHAQKYCANGYFWNSGIFMFETGQFVEAVNRFNPEVYQAFQLPTPQEAYEATPAISVDYGLIEKLDRVFCVPLDIGWNDLGNFTTFYDRYHSNQDENGNVYFNREIMLNCKNDMVYSEGNKAIAMVGMADTVVIDQKDALLICHRDCTQHIKEVVAKLKEIHDPRADRHMTEYYFFGSVTMLESSEMFSVKKLFISPGKKMDYMAASNTKEHWIIVKGTAIVSGDGTETRLDEGESFCAQPHKHYHLMNPANATLALIQVQLGKTFFGDTSI